MTTHEKQDAPKWMTRVLQAAAVYNVLWGASVVLFPGWLFALTGMDQPAYPSIWQCVGMIVGVYGIGYWFAASDPLRHWPIVLVGFLGKIFGPIGYVFGVIQEPATAGFGVTILTNDLIWWVPFGFILWRAAQAAQAPVVDEREVPPLEEAMRGAVAASGRSLDELSHESPRLVVFLRHLGCTFCREALGDIAKKEARFADEGVGVVLVHMSSDEEAAAFFGEYGLADAERISDPSATLYRSFGLGRGTMMQLFGPGVFVRGLMATLRGHKVGKLAGDGFQMPGVFLVRDGKIEQEFRHKSAGDRPDYTELAACPMPA